MNDVLDAVRGLKKLAQAQRTQGNHHLAAETLQRAIALLEEAIAVRKAASPDVGTENSQTWEIGLAAELVEIYGMLGGRQREQGDLVAAIGAYDAGFRYESNPRYGFVNSYNALNRVVTRLLLCPTSLTDSNSLRRYADVEFVDVPRSLRELQVRLSQQVNGVRSNDYWAAGNLAQLRALNGNVSGVFEALDKFAACTPPPPSTAYAAYARTMEMLAKLDTPRRDILIKAEEWLESRIR